VHPSPRLRKTTLANVAASLIAAALVAACGGDGDDATTNRDAAKAGATPSLQAVTASATAGFTIAWSNEPGGVDVALDAADNVYTATWVQGPGGDIALTKRNAAGVVQWTRGFDNTDTTRFEAASGVAVDGQGNAYVSGTIRSGFSNPVNVNSLLMKFASDGTLSWRQVYGNPFDGSSTRRVLADAAGNAYVLGLGMSPTPGLLASVRKFNPDGSTAWTWFDTLGVANPFDLKWGRDGRLLVTGGASVRGGYSTIDPATGQLLSGGFVSSVGGMDIATDSQGATYFTYTNPSGTGGVLRHAGNPFGGLWERALAMSPFRVETDSAGNAIVSGFPETGLGGAAFMKFAPDGTLLWSNQDADGPNVAMLAHARMRLDAAGNAYLAGSTLSRTAVVKVNADGTSAWTAEYPSGGAQAMALGNMLDSAGNPSVHTTVLDFLTTRIDQGTTTAPSADLGVTLVDAPDPVRLNAEVVYSATVRNAGPSAATAVALDALLPGGLTLRGITTTQGRCTGTTAIACSLGDLASGAQATVTIRARARTVGAKVTQASVRAAEADPASANNSASQTTTVVRR
jgi:uncharacterized repeat protein (TIGR01451 family)